jgi:CRP-like cAMP-binding protein
MSDNTVEFLRQVPLFARLPESELRKIARAMKERRFGRNQVLFRQGDPADSLYLVVSGRMRISAADHLGREKVLAFAGSGEVVGEMGLLSGEPRSATAVASTEARLLQLRKSEFDSLIANNLDLMRDLARAVVRRREATQQRALEEAAAGENDPRGLVTTLFSPRGGAGTSTIANSLAVALAQRAPDRVVLMDLHVLFGHIPLLLNVAPRTALAAISPTSLRLLDRENLEFYVTTHAESSLRVLSAVLRPEEGELVTVEHVKAALEALRSQFVHVVIDASRSFADVNLTAIEMTTNLLLVCTPDRACVRGIVQTQRIVRDLLHLPGDPLQYILNHPSPYEDMTTAHVEEAIDARFVEEVPFGGDAVARAALEGNPLVMRWPGSATSKAIVRLAERLEQQQAERGYLASGAALVSTP